MAKNILLKEKIVFKRFFLFKQAFLLERISPLAVRQNKPRFYGASHKVRCSLSLCCSSSFHKVVRLYGVPKSKTYFSGRRKSKARSCSFAK